MHQLTVRGRSFAAAGVAAIVCGIQIGETDFVRLGLVAALVPFAAWLLLRRRDPELWIRRELDATRVEAGTPAEVRLRVGRDPGQAGGPGRVVLEDELPAELGETPSFVVGPIAPGEETQVRYSLHTGRRGRFVVGPVHLRVLDPTGMVDRGRTLPFTTEVLVTPPTELLPSLSLTGRWAGAGEHRTRDLMGSGSPDVTVREYRRGDDLRRVHWPSSARAAQLMVRREEQQWQSRCTLLLDNRRRSHRGHGESSSLETAVGVAASLVRHLDSQDFDVRLVVATERASAHGWHQGARNADLPGQLERLALLTSTPTERLQTGWVGDDQGSGILLAVLGHLDRLDREFLAGVATAGTAAYAVVLDVEQWDRHSTGAAPATEWLRSHGWKAATLRRGEPLTPTWLELAR